MVDSLITMEYYLQNYLPKIIQIFKKESLKRISHLYPEENLDPVILSGIGAIINSKLPKSTKENYKLFFIF